jgi:hypothetical protein
VVAALGARVVAMDGGPLGGPGRTPVVEAHSLGQLGDGPEEIPLYLGEPDLHHSAPEPERVSHDRSSVAHNPK